jgi:TnpA family transposase
MPKIKDLKDQQLYKINRDSDYGQLNVLLDKHIDLDIIKEQLDPMIKIVISLKRRLVPANEIITGVSQLGENMIN